MTVSLLSRDYYCLNAVADVSFLWFSFAVDCFNHSIDLSFKVNLRKSWRFVTVVWQHTSYCFATCKIV